MFFRVWRSEPQKKVCLLAHPHCQTRTPSPPSETPHAVHVVAPSSIPRTPCLQSVYTCMHCSLFVRKSAHTGYRVVRKKAPRTPTCSKLRVMRHRHCHARHTWWIRRVGTSLTPNIEIHGVRGGAQKITGGFFTHLFKLHFRTSSCRHCDCAGLPLGSLRLGLYTTVGQGRRPHAWGWC